MKLYYRGLNLSYQIVWKTDIGILLRYLCPKVNYFINISNIKFLYIYIYIYLLERKK